MKITFRIRRANSKRGFTLVETLAAILLISVAIVAPMGLTVQSIEGAYYARDQITASNLAQEGIEGVRSVRDANILTTALGTQTNLFKGIPTGNAFEVDGTQIFPNNVIIDSSCSGGCQSLATNGTLYGYPSDSGFNKPTIFTRTMTASVVRSDGSGTAQEIQVTSTVSWKTAAYKTNSITLTENLYNWIALGSGA
jgi:prepilin-type N-terminal cleavage/methylation domain-containing protein